MKAVGKALKGLWSSSHYRKTIIILILTEIGGTLYYFGTNYALDEIGYDYGANMISTGAI